MANSIIAGNDFRLIIRAKKSTGAYLADMDLADVEDLRIYLTRAGRSKVLQSYTLDEEGHAVIYVSAGVVTNATYGIEMVGVYGGARLRAHNTSVFTISGHGGGNSGVLNDYYADIVFVINVAATDVYVQNAIEAHNEDEASHPHLLQLIEDAGDVDDVQIDGESIVDENKIAKIVSSQFGKVNDVKVNGTSVVSNKEAEITIPEKVSDLPNDADYATKSELTTGLDAKQDTITAVVEPTIADDGGNPSASVEFEGGEMAFAFRNLKLRFSDLTAADKAELKGDKGDQGDSAVYDPSSPDAPDFVMANTTGQSTTKAMTQKAVTDALLQTSSDAFDLTFKATGFLSSIIMLGEYTLNKDSLKLASGCYVLTNGVIQYKDTGGYLVHSCISFDVKGLPLKSIKITNASTASIANLLYVSGNTITTKKLANDTVENLPSSIDKIYLNFFSIENYPQTAFVLTSTIDMSSIEQNLPLLSQIQIDSEKGLTNNVLYGLLGVPMDEEGYLNTSGVFNSSAFWRSSLHIPVIKGDVIKYKLNGQADAVASVALYDANKTFISTGSILPDESGVISGSMTIPEGVAYIRCCTYHHSNYDSTVLQTYKTCYALIDSMFSVKEKMNEENGDYSQIQSAISKVNETIRLFDSIKKPIVFSGKKLVAFGDSITYGVCSPNLGNAGENKYISLFCSAAGCTLDNRAVSGQCIVPGQNGNGSIYNRVTTFTGTADIIWIAGGVNDWQTQSPIGTLADADSSTLYGALNGMCAYLKANYPNAIVIFVTPIPTTSTTTFDVEHPDNLNLYRKAIQEVAAVNGYNVINGDGLGLAVGMTDYGNAMFDSSDRVHPTLAGHRLYANSLCGKLL